MRILTFDPSLRNWAYVHVTLNPATNKLSHLDSGIITTVKSTPRERGLDTVSAVDMEDSQKITEILIPMVKNSDIVISELPIGSQSASGMKMYGIVIGVLSTVRILQPNFIGVTPDKVKLALTGSSTADKHAMIEKALILYPKLNWVKNTKGKILGESQHIADAAGVLTFYLKQIGVLQ